MFATYRDDARCDSGEHDVKSDRIVARPAGENRMNSTISDGQSLLDLMHQACDRRQVGEIDIESVEGEHQLGRVRLIACDEQAVYIDRPTCEGMPLELAAHSRAMVHFLFDGERYSFRSRIVEECRVSLGDNQTIPGFSLEIPDQIFRDERRHDYRASLGKCAEVICSLRLLDGPEACAFDAQVMNISAGGMAVIAIELNGHNLARGNGYSVEFSLPGVNRLFSLNTQLCHLRTLGGAGYIMGLRFLPETDATQMRHAVRQISQFVSKQLKK